MLKAVIVIALAAMATLLASALYGAWRWHRDTQHLRARLDEARQSIRAGIVDFHELETLPGHVVLAVLLAAVGLVICVAGVVQFRRAKTTVNPLTPETTTAMVTSGIYRFSRNPMYLGFLLALTGWAVFLSHVLVFVFLPLFVVYMNRFQIIREERALAAKFGRHFTDYRGSVRRWL